MTRYSIRPESESSPETITNIITTKSDFDKAFATFPTEVDFERQMLVLFFHTGDAIGGPALEDRVFSYRIKRLTADDETIHIVFAKKKLVLGLTDSPPTQECLLVVMDKVDAKTANIELTYERIKGDI